MIFCSSWFHLSLSLKRFHFCAYFPSGCLFSSEAGMCHIVPAGCRAVCRHCRAAGAGGETLVNGTGALPRERELPAPNLEPPSTGDRGEAGGWRSIGETGATTKLRFRFTFKQQRRRRGGEAAGCAGERAAGEKRPALSALPSLARARHRVPAQQAPTTITTRSALGPSSHESWTLEVGLASTPSL